MTSMINPSLRRFLWRLSGPLFVVGLGATSGSVQAAEKVTFAYGPFARSISVDILQEFSDKKVAPQELASLLSLAGKDQEQLLLKGLEFKIPLNVVVMDKILRSPQGDQILTKVAALTSLPGGQEKLALRSALVLGAASKDGFSLLSFLKAYPSQNMRINVAKVQKFVESDSFVKEFLGGFLSPSDASTAPTEAPASQPSTPEAVPSPQPPSP